MPLTAAAPQKRVSKGSRHRGRHRHSAGDITTKVEPQSLLKAPSAGSEKYNGPSQSFKKSIFDASEQILSMSEEGDDGNTTAPTLSLVVLSRTGLDLSGIKQENHDIYFQNIIQLMSPRNFGLMPEDSAKDHFPRPSSTPSDLMGFIAQNPTTPQSIRFYPSATTTQLSFSTSKCRLALQAILATQDLNSLKAFVEFSPYGKPWPLIMYSFWLQTITRDHLDTDLLNLMLHVLDILPLTKSALDACPLKPYLQHIRRKVNGISAETRAVITRLLQKWKHNSVSAPKQPTLSSVIDVDISESKISKPSKKDKTGPVKPIIAPEIFVPVDKDLLVPESALPKTHVRKPPVQTPPRNKPSNKIIYCPSIAKQDDPIYSSPDLKSKKPKIKRTSTIQNESPPLAPSQPVESPTTTEPLRKASKRNVKEEPTIAMTKLSRSAALKPRAEEQTALEKLRKIRENRIKRKRGESVSEDDNSSSDVSDQPRVRLYTSPSSSNSRDSESDCVDSDSDEMDPDILADIYRVLPMSAKQSVEAYGVLSILMKRLDEVDITMKGMSANEKAHFEIAAAKLDDYFRDLERNIQSSRWDKKGFKQILNGYRTATFYKLKKPLTGIGCIACSRSNCKVAYKVELSNPIKTSLPLEEAYYLGSGCASRSRLFHKVAHWKEHNVLQFKTSSLDHFIQNLIDPTEPYFVDWASVHASAEWANMISGAYYHYEKIKEMADDFAEEN